MRKALLTFKLITLLLTSQLFVSCSEEEREAFTILAGLTLLYTTSYTHTDGSNYFYRTQGCETEHVYYASFTRVSTYCRYYSYPGSGQPSGYYIVTDRYYNDIAVYY